MSTESYKVNYEQRQYISDMIKFKVPKVLLKYSYENKTCIRRSLNDSVYVMIRRKNILGINCVVVCAYFKIDDNNEEFNKFFYHLEELIVE